MREKLPPTSPKIQLAPSLEEQLEMLDDKLETALDEVRETGWEGDQEQVDKLRTEIEARENVLMTEHQCDSTVIFMSEKGKTVFL